MAATSTGPTRRVQHGALHLRPLFADDGRTLVVQSTVIDTVAYCAEEMKEPLDDDDASLSHNLTVFMGWLAMALRDAILPEGPETLADAVYYLLGSPDADLKLLYQLIGRVTAGKISGLETPGAVERLLTDLKLPEHKNALVDFEYCCSKLANGRVLFISSKGYLCSGSEGIAVGDSVALVAGVPLPLILRAAGDGKIAWTVVGPAVVAGITNGDAWRPEDLAEMVLIYKDEVTVSNSSAIVFGHQVHVMASKIEASNRSEETANTVE